MTIYKNIYVIFFSFLFQVLTDADHCYCVVLNAVGGAAFPSEKLLEDSGLRENSTPKKVWCYYLNFSCRLVTFRYLVGVSCKI